jgi:predicted nucleic acid-binding protein
MSKVFADTVYWIAITRPNDQWAKPTRKAAESLGEADLVTTDEVLTEFLTAMSGGGPELRRAAVEITQRALTNPRVRVVPQSRRSFLEALERYARREDKAYSLVDCAAMNAMDAAGIRDVLTNDRHFTQEGYHVLIRR